MSDTEAITDDVVGKAYMENFAGNIFTKADDEERAKKATRTTATKFLAAAQFMEVLRSFGDLDREVLDDKYFANERHPTKYGMPNFNAPGF
jgi:vacuolar protein sorting-associated protein VTA1